MSNRTRCRPASEWIPLSVPPMIGRDGTWHHYYYCAGHDVLRARGAIGRCPQRNLRADELDDLVWAEVRRHLENPALILEAYTRLQTEAMPRADTLVAHDVRDLQKKLAEFDREEHRLLDAYQAGLIALDQLGRRQALLHQRRAHVEGSLEALQNDRTAALERAQLHTNLESFMRHINEPLATLPFEHR